MTANSPSSPARFCFRRLSANSHGWPERKMDSAAGLTRSRRRGEAGLDGFELDTASSFGEAAGLLVLHPFLRLILHLQRRFQPRGKVADACLPCFRVGKVAALAPASAKVIDERLANPGLRDGQKI